MRMGTDTYGLFIATATGNDKCVKRIAPHEINLLKKSALVTFDYYLLYFETKLMLIDSDHRRKPFVVTGSICCSYTHTCMHSSLHAHSHP